MGCCGGLKLKCRETLVKAHLAFTITKLLLYIADIGTDVNTAYQFFQQGDVVWAGLTVSFIILPCIIFGIGAFYVWFIAADADDSDVSGVMKLFWLIVVICLSPIAVPIMFVCGSVSTIRTGEDDGTPASIKLIETMTEAFPQASLQMYIICQVWYGNDGTVISPWQWVSLALSLLSLSSGIATSMFVDGADTSSKVVFFSFGLLTVISRLVTCSLYSVVIKPMWLLPFGTIVTAGIIVWIVKRYCKCSGCAPLNKIHHEANLGQMIGIVLAWFTTAMFNSFTLSSIPSSSVNLAYAVGGYFLLPDALGITAVALAVFNLLVNTLMVIVPKFRGIAEQWLVTHGDDECYHY